MKAQRQYTVLLPATDIEIHPDKRARDKQTVRPIFRPTTALPYDNHHAMDSVWYRESSLSSQWRNILKRCKVPYRRIYQTRHTFACWQLTAHDNIAFIADRMGHTLHACKKIRLLDEYRKSKRGGSNMVGTGWQRSYVVQGHENMPQKCPIIHTH